MSTQTSNKNKLKMDTIQQIIVIFGKWGIEIKDDNNESLSKEKFVKNKDLLLYLSDEWVKDNKDYVHGLYHQFVDENYVKMKWMYAIAIEKGHTISMNNLGFYHNHITKDYNLMKKWYEMAIEKGNVISMNNLGIYYKNIEKDYTLMKFYFEMAIEKGHTKSMNDLGSYYYETIIDGDYVKMKKLYEMAIEKGFVASMCNLGFYYKEIERDYVKMKFYFEIAIEKGCVISMHNLGFYYQYIEKDYVKMKKYYEMSIEKGYDGCVNELKNYYIRIEIFEMDGLKFALKHGFVDLFDYTINLIYNSNIKLNDELFDILNKVDSSIFKLPELFKHLINSLSIHVDLLENHYKYQPKGYGFEDAKKEFLSFSLK